MLHMHWKPSMPDPSFPQHSIFSLHFLHSLDGDGLCHDLIDMGWRAEALVSCLSVAAESQGPCEDTPWISAQFQQVRQQIAVCRRLLVCIHVWEDCPTPAGQQTTAARRKPMKPMVGPTTARKTSNYVDKFAWCASASTTRDRKQPQITTWRQEPI